MWPTPGTSGSRSLTAATTFLREWPVEGWYGESVVNKPFLAVDGLGRVYVTDPEGYLVIVFDSDGRAAGDLWRLRHDANSFTLPTGIDVDDAGYIYVTDTERPAGDQVRAAAVRTWCVVRVTDHAPRTTF